MTPEQFWYDEPRLLDVYIKKQELQRDDMNYNAWLIGLYVEKSLSTVLGAMFSKKGTKIEPYFEKPIEELNSDFILKKKEEIKTNKEEKYNVQFNYWAKIGKKGGNN